MAGYKYNYGQSDPAEYSDLPFADHLNGTRGTNSPAAKLNQTIQQKPATGKADPYSAFAEWGKSQAAPQLSKALTSGYAAQPETKQTGDNPPGFNLPGNQNPPPPPPQDQTPPPNDTPPPSDTPTPNPQPPPPIPDPPPTGQGSPFGNGNQPPANTPAFAVDQWGIRVDQSNPPDKPPGTEDPAIAAQWYKWWIPDITAADVVAYRTSGFNGKIDEWWRAGKPGNPAAQPPNPSDDYMHGGGGVPGLQLTDIQKYNQWYQQQFAQWQKDHPGEPFPGIDKQGNLIQPPNPNNQPPPPPPTNEQPPPPTEPPPPAPPEDGTPGQGGNGQPEGQQEQFTMPTLDGMDNFSKYLDPLFKQQQAELARVLRSEGALTGDINSGGFNETLGRQEANLIAQQGQQKMEGMQKAQEFGLQKYQIDADLFSKQMADATTRYGIDTNFKLQQWLDQQDNELKKYGIDKADLLERYKAELQKEGIVYSADAQVRAAALARAAQAAAAAANLQAQKYGYDIQKQIADNNTNFNWGKLQADLFSGDQDRMIQWAQILAMAGMTPADLIKILQTFGPSPPIFNNP